MGETEQTFCGGRLEDESECNASCFEPAIGRWIARVPSAWKAAWVQVLVHVCPYCGTALGVTTDGEPVTEPMVLERIRGAEILQVAQQAADAAMQRFWDSPIPGKEPVTEAMVPTTEPPVQLKQLLDECGTAACQLDQLADSLRETGWSEEACLIRRLADVAAEVEEAEHGD